MPRPGYPLFDYLAGLESVRRGAVPARATTASGTWTSPRCARRSAPRTRAVVVVNPNNPTGASSSGTSSTRSRRLCAERGLALDLGRGLRGLRVRRRRRGGRRASRATARPWPSPWAASRSRCGAAPAQAGLDARCAGRKPRGAEALARLELVADTYLSVVDARAARGRRRSSAAARELQAPIARAGRAATCAALRSVLVGGGSPATLLRSEGGWYGRPARPRHPVRGGARAAACSRSTTCSCTPATSSTSRARPTWC